MKSFKQFAESEKKKEQLEDKEEKGKEADPDTSSKEEAKNKEKVSKETSKTGKSKVEVYNTDRQDL